MIISSTNAISFFQMINEGIIFNSSSEMICENESACLKPALHPCHHCSKYLCLDHLNEHNDLNIVRVEELSDDMNKMTDLISNLDTKTSVENALVKLDTWKEENHARIDNIYKDQLDAIHRLKDELNDRLNIFKQRLEPPISDLKGQLSYFKKIGQTSEQVISIRIFQ